VGLPVQQTVDQVGGFVCTIISSCDLLLPNVINLCGILTRLHLIKMNSLPYNEYHSHNKYTLLMKGNQEGKIQKGKCFKENKCIHHNTQININNTALK